MQHISYYNDEVKVKAFCSIAVEATSMQSGAGSRKPLRDSLTRNRGKFMHRTIRNNLKQQRIYNAFLSGENSISCPRTGI